MLQGAKGSLPVVSITAAVRSQLQVWTEDEARQFHVGTVPNLHIRRHTAQYSKLCRWMETFRSSILYHYHLGSMRLPKKLRTYRIDNSLSSGWKGSNDKTQGMNSNKRSPSAVSQRQCKPSQSTRRKLLTTTRLTWNLQLKPKDSQFKSRLYVGTTHRLRSRCPSPERCWHSAVPKVIYKCAPERPQLLKQRAALAQSGNKPVPYQANRQESWRHAHVKYFPA